MASLPITTSRFANLRLAVLTLTGLVCLAYAALVITTGRPNPFPAWVPGACGGLAGLTIFLSARLAREAAAQATDEGFFADWGRAQRVAYWVALALYPLFGLLTWSGALDRALALPAMGTLTGGAVLILFALFDLQGR